MRRISRAQARVCWMMLLVIAGSVALGYGLELRATQSAETVIGMVEGWIKNHPNDGAACPAPRVRSLPH